MEQGVPIPVSEEEIQQEMLCRDPTTSKIIIIELGIIGVEHPFPWYLPTSPSPSTSFLIHPNYGGGFHYSALVCYLNLVELNNILGSVDLVRDQMTRDGVGST